MVSNKEIFGFSSQKTTKDYKNHIINNFGRNSYVLANKNIQKMSYPQWKSYQDILDKLFKKMAKIMDKYDFNSKRVQKIIAKHYRLSAKFNKVSKDSYINLANLYSEHEEFIEFFNQYKEGLSEFLHNAMLFFADTKVSI
ncbi:MAG: TipAS antibiotic-recognition domain-containing protein [Methanobrevibacter sp.]|jgi:hypothetical protein|nr:TipAS antibiotic-recognition domain-containing protein [Methanobrevibacter sp.]